MITGGDYLFDPASGSRYSKDDDHIAQIIELMGEIPKSVAFAGKYSSEFFNRKGELRHINKLRYWPLDAVLNDKYLFPKEEAEALASFLVPMLRLHPDKRAKSGDLSYHNWLDGIVVQGEVDVVRRAEEDDARRKKMEGKGKGKDGESGSRDMSPGSKLQAALDQSEVDAMKPVDDIAVLGESERVAPATSQVPKLAQAPVSSSTSGAKENVTHKRLSSGVVEKSRSVKS